MKIEAKLLASAEDTRIKKIRAPNFFIFSTNSEKSLLDPEPVGRLLKIKKSSTTTRSLHREKCATRNLRKWYLMFVLFIFAEHPSCDDRRNRGTSS